MKKINLRGLSEVLNERELRNVMGGSDLPTNARCYYYRCSSSGPCTVICYNGFDTCLAEFSYICPAGGFFWACEE